MLFQGGAVCREPGFARRKRDTRLCHARQNGAVRQFVWLRAQIDIGSRFKSAFKI
jgi:hypothetical protein